MVENLSKVPNKSQEMLLEELESLRNANRDLQEKNARLVAQETQRRLDTALRQAKMAYWRWDLTEQSMSYFSDHGGELLGYPADQPPQNFDEVSRYIHPDDRERVLQTYHDAGIENPRNFVIEYRVYHPDGRLIHLRELGELERDANSKAIAHFGTLQDITDLKEAEKKTKAK